MIKPVLASLVTGMALLTSCPGAMSQNNGLVEPQLRLTGAQKSDRVIAVTLDACSGQVDHRILDLLITERIPATLFITARWLRDNEETFRTILKHPELFQVEDHGGEHIPPVLGEEKVYGIVPAGTAEKIAEEVQAGARALTAAGAPQPSWYRGATALYSPAAIPLIRGLGYKIAGFSLNADYGASASAETARANLLAARSGDVVIAHINQPGRPAGQGIAEGLLALKASGVRFVKLNDMTAVSNLPD